MATNHARHADFAVSFCEGQGVRGKAKNKTSRWQEFLACRSKPLRTAETHCEFFKLPKDDQDTLKSVNGWIIGGTSIDGRRKRSSILERTFITIDIEGKDFTPAMLESLQDGTNSICRYEWAIHSSRKHTDEKPRIRMFVPMTRPVLAAEYEAAVRLFAAIFDQ